MRFQIKIPATPANFSEEGYLRANPDVAAALTRREIQSGRQHFDIFGVVEERRLYASFLDVLRHYRRSIRASGISTEHAAAPTGNKTRTACVCVVKNAERRIAEWIAFHLAVGFDAVIVLDNASTDGTAGVVTRFREHYDVRLIDWPMSGPAYQVRGSEYAVWSVRNEFDWCACIDDDEFLVLPQGHAVGAMLASVPSEVGAIALPWAVFGSNGRLEPPEDLVISSYTRRAPEDFSANRHIKSIVRPSRVHACMNPHAFRVDGGYATTTGARLTISNSVVKDTIPFSGGKLHHYFVRSRACWNEKLSRGYPDAVRRASDFEKFDRNDVFDESARRFEGAVREILDRVDRP